MIEYFRADERPAWAATVIVNGVTDDMSSGYTFQVKIAADRTATPLVTKTTNITGATLGRVTVAWAPNELDITPGDYYVQLKASRTADSLEWTVEDRIRIKARL